RPRIAPAAAPTWARSATRSASTSPPTRSFSSSEVPSAITWPLSTTAIWFARRSASSRYCVVSSSVVPSFTSSRMMSHISRRLLGSRPVVGSSRNRICGRPTRLAPRSRRRRIPPDYVFAVRCAAPLSSNRSSTSSRLRCGEVVQPPDHLEVLEAGEVLVHGGGLPCEADHVAEPLRILHDVVARNRRSAAIGTEQRGQDPHGRRLAGSVRAEQAE